MRYTRIIRSSVLRYSKIDVCDSSRSNLEARSKEFTLGVDYEMKSREGRSAISTGNRNLLIDELTFAIVFPGWRLCNTSTDRLCEDAMHKQNTQSGSKWID